MKTVNTVIDGYEIELTSQKDGADEVTHCYIMKGSHSGTLEWLESYGCLTRADGSDGPKLKQLFQERVRTWADANGY